MQCIDEIIELELDYILSFYIACLPNFSVFLQVTKPLDGNRWHVN